METPKTKKLSKYLILTCLFGLLGAILIVGCATIIHGSRQSITVNSVPSGAKIIKMGAQLGTTPAVIKLDRNESNIILRFEKEGYEPVEVVLNRSVDAWIVGNIVFGGLIGLAVDFITGAAYKLSPSELNATLATLKSQGYDIDRHSLDNMLIVVDMQTLQSKE